MYINSYASARVTSMSAVDPDTVSDADTESDDDTATNSTRTNDTKKAFPKKRGRPPGAKNLIHYDSHGYPLPKKPRESRKKATTRDTAENFKSPSKTKTNVKSSLRGERNFDIESAAIQQTATKENLPQRKNRRTHTDDDAKFDADMQRALAESMVPPKPPDAITGFPGLENSGNDCYRNAIYQMFFHSGSSEQIVCDKSLTVNHKTSITADLASLFAAMKTGDPHAIKNAQKILNNAYNLLYPEFDNQNQQDSSLFGTCLYDQMKENCSGVKRFNTVLTQHIKCVTNTCPISTSFTNQFLVHLKVKNDAKTCALSEIISSCSNRVPVSRICGQCTKDNATMEIVCDDPNEYVTFALDREMRNRSVKKMIKTSVIYPLKNLMYGHSKNVKTYNLQCVINYESGKTIEHGHYVALVRKTEEGEFVKLSDSRATVAVDDDFNPATVKMLMYKIKSEPSKRCDNSMTHEDGGSVLVEGSDAKKVRSTVPSVEGEPTKSKQDDAQTDDEIDLEDAADILRNMSHTAHSILRDSSDSGSDEDNDEGEAEAEEVEAEEAEEVEVEAEESEAEEVEPTEEQKEQKQLETQRNNAQINATTRGAGLKQSQICEESSPPLLRTSSRPGIAALNKVDLAPVTGQPTDIEGERRLQQHAMPKGFAGRITSRQTSRGYHANNAKRLDKQISVKRNAQGASSAFDNVDTWRSTVIADNDAAFRRDSYSEEFLDIFSDAYIYPCREFETIQEDMHYFVNLVSSIDADKRPNMTSNIQIIRPSEREHDTDNHFDTYNDFNHSSTEEDHYINHVKRCFVLSEKTDYDGTRYPCSTVFIDYSENDKASQIHAVITDRMQDLTTRRKCALNICRAVMLYNRLPGTKNPITKIHIDAWDLIDTTENRQIILAVIKGLVQGHGENLTEEDSVICFYGKGSAFMEVYKNITSGFNVTTLPPGSASSDPIFPASPSESASSRSGSALSPSGSASRPSESASSRSGSALSPSGSASRPSGSASRPSGSADSATMSATAALLSAVSIAPYTVPAEITQTPDSLSKTATIATQQSASLSKNAAIATRQSDSLSKTATFSRQQSASADASRVASTTDVCVNYMMKCNYKHLHTIWGSPALVMINSMVR